MEVRTSRLEVLFLMFCARVMMSSSCGCLCSRSPLVTYNHKTGVLKWPGFSGPDVVCNGSGRGKWNFNIFKVKANTLSGLILVSWPAGVRWWCGSHLCLPLWRCWIWASGGWGGASPLAPWPSGWDRSGQPALGCDGAPRSADWPCELQAAHSLRDTHNPNTQLDLEEQRECPFHLSAQHSLVKCCWDTCFVHGDRGCCGVSFNLTSRAFQSAASCSILLCTNTHTSCSFSSTSLFMCTSDRYHFVYLNREKSKITS